MGDFVTEFAVVTKRKRGRPRLEVTRPASGTIDYWVDKLERNAPTDPQAASLLEQIRAKTLKGTAAAEIMGWRKPPNPLGTAISAYRRLTPAEKSEFMERVK
jgi:hypothetical protein